MCGAQSQRAAATDRRNDPDPRPQQGRSVPQIVFDALREEGWRFAYAVAPANVLNTSPVLSMLCMMIASLRATATAARLKPNRSRSLSPQLLRLLSFLALVLVRITVAAS